MSSAEMWIGIVCLVIMLVVCYAVISTREAADQRDYDDVKRLDSDDLKKPPRL